MGHNPECNQRRMTDAVEQTAFIAGISLKQCVIKNEQLTMMRSTLPGHTMLCWRNIKHKNIPLELNGMLQELCGVHKQLCNLKTEKRRMNDIHDINKWSVPNLPLMSYTGNLQVCDTPQSSLKM